MNFGDVLILDAQELDIKVNGIMKLILIGCTNK